MKISLSKPYITQNAIDAVSDVLKSGWITQGKKVVEFEEAIATLLGVKYAIAVNSATAGLHASLVSLGIGPHDEVIVPSFTWVSTANVVEMCGAKVVFADIDLDSYNVSEQDLLKKVTSNTKAVIPVHLFGKPIDILSLKQKLPESIFIVEDAACALGSKYDESFSGTQGNLGVFSFHPRKSITTGEGGIVVTNDESQYKNILMLRNHGQDISTQSKSLAKMLDCPIVGYNYRMTDMQAALGASQLNTLHENINFRSQIAKAYFKLLAKNENLKLPSLSKSESHSWQSFVIRVPSEFRDRIINYLIAQGIETRPGTHAVHNLSYYQKKYHMTNMACPNADKASKTSIALPMHNYLDESDIEFVSEKVLESLEVIA